MSTVQVPLYSKTGEASGTFDLPETLFPAAGSRRILHEVVVAYQGNQRRGTSETKTRGNVSGGGRKPWKQKGTGNARAGTIRSPLWRKGGIIFGPHPRSYRVDIPGAQKLMALQTALIEKARAGQIGVIDILNFEQPKTRQADQWFGKTGLAGSILLVVDKKDAALLRAVRNILRLSVVDAAELNAWVLMRGRHVLVTKAALDILAARFPKG